MERNSFWLMRLGEGVGGGESVTALPRYENPKTLRSQEGGPGGGDSNSKLSSNKCGDSAESIFSCFMFDGIMMSRSSSKKARVGANKSRFAFFGFLRFFLRLDFEGGFDASPPTEGGGGGGGFSSSAFVSFLLGDKPKRATLPCGERGDVLGLTDTLSDALTDTDESCSVFLFCFVDVSRFGL